MSQPFDFANRPHRRRNPLTGDWVLVSPQRNLRPWQGHTHESSTLLLESYDPNCYLCPDNERAGGEKNPSYGGVYTFSNDFPALTEVVGSEPFGSQRALTPDLIEDDPLFTSHAESGTCRVITYSQDHSKSLAELPANEIASVIRTWSAQTEELAQQFPWIQIFENKGEIMGCSMPHPHGQVWAQKHAPSILAREEDHQAHYFREHGEPLLLTYAIRELKEGARVVVHNEDWLAVVPYWASWPFETLVLPNFKVAQLTDLSASQTDSLADLLSKLLIRYDNLFECSFPYSMGWHGAPFNSQANDHWQLHAHFYPPLLRSASVRKFMVGYEMLAEAQRDITPEQAASALQELSSVHYRQKT